MEKKLQRLRELLEIKDATDKEIASLIGETEPKVKRTWTRRTPEVQS